MTTSPYENVFPKENRGCSPFTKCCFCIPLRTGCFILGYLSLVLNFIITLFFVGTLAFLAIYTHGFRYISMKEDDDGHKIPDEDAMDRPKMNLTIIVIVLVGCLNFAWFLINVVLLVGLHRKRPSHIKIHVTVATIRLLLSILAVIMYGAHTMSSMAICCSEIGLSAYFILLYYMYALQLEREQRYTETDSRPVSEIIADVVFSYPQNIDKITLTGNDDKFVTA